MQHSAATIPNFDKSHLFSPLPEYPLNPNMDYLQCPATGHFYCLTTGSLYQVTSTIMLSSNIQLLLQQRERCFSLLPSNPAPCTERVSSKNPNNNVVPSIRVNMSSITPGDQCNNPKNLKSKSSLPPQGNPPPQSYVKSSTYAQSNTATTTKIKKNKKKHMKIILDKPVPTQANSASPKKKSASAKQNKSTVPSQVKPSKTFIRKSAPNTTPLPLTQIKPASHSMRHSTTTAQSKPNTHSQYNPFINHKSKSMPKLIRPIQNTFNHVFPQEESASLNLRKFPVEITQICPMSVPINNSKLQSRGKSSLNVSREDDVVLGTFKKRRKTSVHVSRRANNESIWRFLVPFNRRPRLEKPRQHHKREPVSVGQCKNCIMASSVHEIIHSRFTKNNNERMPVSQLGAMLNSGERKLRIGQEWMRRMEEEAIHRYKKLSLENHKRRLKVKDNDVLSHPEKPWLVSFGRNVIDKMEKDSWPLLVKCLYRYPDSTLRQASKHRSFCLTWTGTSYILSRDHAYYTQIQCHMAITETFYAELLVHTNKETTVVPVYFDYVFWEQTETKLDAFYTENVLPYMRKYNTEPDLIRDSFVSQEIHLQE